MIELQDFDVIVWDRYQGMSVVRLIDSQIHIVGTDAVEWIPCSFPRNALMVYRDGELIWPKSLLNQNRLSSDVENKEME